MESNYNYIDAYTELQQIVSEIELGDVNVDELARKIQRASQLIIICKAKLTASEEEVTKTSGIFDKAIARADMKVEVEALDADALPVSVTIDEFMRRMKDMAKTGGGMGFYGTIPDQYKVTVNGNHPLVKRILESGEEEGSQLAKQAFDLALLSRGLLTGADLTAFVKRSVELI